MPDGELGSLRPWNPNSLADRRTGERRAANQPGARPESPAQQEIARARELAVRQGYAEGQALAAQQAARLQGIATALQAATLELERDFGEDLLSMALDLARHILRTEIATNHEPLLTAVREVLAAAPEALGARELMLNPQDVELVKAELGGEQHLGSWRIIADPSIERGGCRLVSKSRDIDATLATRWQRALQRFGRQDPLEPKA
jgi:flagellar assembly protein FliH